MKYVLIVVSYGDGTSDFGLRITSMRFNTADAANAAGAWLNEIEGVSTCRIYEDAPPIKAK